MTLAPSVYELELADQLLTAAIRDAESIIAKGAADSAREQLLGDVVPDFAAALEAYFRRFGDRVASRISKATAWDLDPDDLDWRAEADELTALLREWYTVLGERAFSDLADKLAVELRFDLNARNLSSVVDRIANQVTSITEESRGQLRTLVQGAIERNSNADQLARGLRVLTDKWAGIDRAALTAALKDESVDGWVKGYIRSALEQSTTRAQTIALTETANGYNAAAVAGYRDSGLVDQVEVFDGDDCGWTDHDDPDLANGSIRTLDEADEYPISHPHCQRAFGAVVATS